MKARVHLRLTNGDAFDVLVNFARGDFTTLRDDVMDTLRKKWGWRDVELVSVEEVAGK